MQPLLPDVWCGSGWLAVRLVTESTLAATNLHDEVSHPEQAIDKKGSCRSLDLAPDPWIPDTELQATSMSIRTAWR